MKALSLFLCLLHLALLAGCDDRSSGGDGGDGDGDAGDGDTGDGDAGDGDGAMCTPRSADDIPDAAGCEVGAMDYVPCTDDGWDACISDDGEYHRIEPNISSVARVAAFEEIADMLFDPTVDADPDTFVAARLLYQEDEGLDSRVVRRYDPHFDVPDGTDCTADGVPAQYPDYCVGPAVLALALLDAFNAGIDGMDPRQNAARVEAYLLWFLYVSTAKESLTCTDKAKDCDSAYAYYTGGEPARGGLGLSRYVAEVDPYAHDRAWDGLLALRCWRDLDDEETAAELGLRDMAREQYDRALLYGLAVILEDRLSVLFEGADDGVVRYQSAFVAALAPALDRAMRAVDSDLADALADAVASEPVQALVAQEALTAVFDCP